MRYMGWDYASLEDCPDDMLRVIIEEMRGEKP